MDWDKLRIFHAAAEAGSFTHAGDTLNLSQSAVSRQVSALEKDLKVSLFHRHARGLILTEQGELLYRTAHEVFNKLQSTQTRLQDSKTKPFGDLRVTTTVGFGAGWLTPRLREFVELYPDIRLQLLLTDGELDLSMREADVGIRLWEPTQPDLIRRRLFTVHFHVYASAAYIKRHGAPTKVDELDNHRILTFGDREFTPLREINWLETAGRTEQDGKRVSVMEANNIHALRQAVRQGIGIAVLPDYMAGADQDLVPVLRSADVPEFDTFFCYPEELKNSKRVTAFRDFLVARAREWSF